MTTPFPSDHEHAAWDREYVERFWEALDWTDRVLEEFSGWFNGKTSPVHLFWHSLDLAVTRFSGRDAPPVEADPVTQEAYSREVISFGFWAGDDNLGDAAFYSYTAPEPDGLREQPLVGGSGGTPATARWRSCPTRRSAPPRTRGRRCSPSCRAPTKRARAPPAGTPRASSRTGVPCPRSARGGARSGRPDAMGRSGAGRRPGATSPDTLEERTDLPRPLLQVRAQEQQLLFVGNLGGGERLDPAGLSADGPHHSLGGCAPIASRRAAPRCSARPRTPAG